MRQAIYKFWTTSFFNTRSSYRFDNNSALFCSILLQILALFNRKKFPCGWISQTLSCDRLWQVESKHLKVGKQEFLQNSPPSLIFEGQASWPSSNHWSEKKKTGSSIYCVISEAKNFTAVAFVRPNSESTNTSIPSEIVYDGVWTQPADEYTQWNNSVTLH